MNSKTVIFGQQTRLRNGMMMPDEQLPRFHAGHDIVKFFYSAVRQLPPYLVDALLAALFVRLDQSENYPELCDQVLGLGEYARSSLEEIVANADLFADELRGPIRDKSHQLLSEI